MKRNADWKQQISRELDKVEASLPQLPLVEIAGDRRVLIEHHQGVSQYGRGRICVQVSYGVIAVEGDNLELARMTNTQLVISGSIRCVSLIRRGERCL